MTTHIRAQLIGLLFLAVSFGSLGCASHGDLLTLRKELQSSLSQTRNDQLQAAETLQYRLKELQTVQQKQQHALDSLQTAVTDLKGQPQLLKRAIEELKVKMDLISQDLGHLRVSVRGWNDRLLQSLRREQQELQNWLRMVDQSLLDIEATETGNQTKMTVSQDHETAKH